MCAGRHALSWFCQGYAPGLIVTNRYRPSSSVRHRPAPVKLGSSGDGCRSRRGGTGRRRSPATPRQRVPNRPAAAVQHPAVDDDALALRLAVVLRGQVVVGGADPALAEQRAGQLGQAVRQRARAAGTAPGAASHVVGIQVGRIDRLAVSRVWLHGDLDTSALLRERRSCRGVRRRPVARDARRPLEVSTMRANVREAHTQPTFDGFPGARSAFPRGHPGLTRGGLRGWVADPLAWRPHDPSIPFRVCPSVADSLLPGRRPHRRGAGRASSAGGAQAESGAKCGTLWSSVPSPTPGFRLMGRS